MYMYFYSHVAPNVYSLPGMIGPTRQSGVRQAPCYSLTGRSKIGGFHEDLQKVRNAISLMQFCYNVIPDTLYKMTEMQLCSPV